MHRQSWRSLCTRSIARCSGARCSHDVMPPAWRWSPDAWADVLHRADQLCSPAVGNVHSIMQVAPIVSIEGAMLRVRAERIAEFDARVRDGVPRYVRVWRHVPRFTIGNVNSSDNEVTDPARATTYLVISGGGKWGYDTLFRDFLEQIAPCLEDGRFFLGDEYSRMVVEHRFSDGVLAIDHLANDSDLETYAEPYLVTPAQRATYARQRLAMWLHFREPAGGMALVDELLALEPRAWEAH